MSHDCNTGKLRPERLFMPAHHLMLTFTEEGRKTFELWLQHQIIFSTYKKITLRVTVNALYEQGMLLTPGSQMSDVKCPWNILRGAVSSKVLTIWFTSQQVFADILLIPGLKFKELFLGRSSLLFPVAHYLLCSLSHAERGGQGDSQWLHVSIGRCPEAEASPECFCSSDFAAHCFAMETVISWGLGI